MLNMRTITVGAILLVGIFQVLSSKPVEGNSSPEQIFLADNDGDDTLLHVPGNSPFLYCSDPANDILNVYDVHFEPEHPLAPQNLTVELYGELSKNIKFGSHVKYEVTLRVQEVDIPVISELAELCEVLADQLDDTDYCPIELGELRITKEIELPEDAAQRTVFVRFNVTDQDDERITCMEAELWL